MPEKPRVPLWRWGLWWTILDRSVANSAFGGSIPRTIGTFATLYPR